MAQIFDVREAKSFKPRLVVRTIHISDIEDALKLGVADFSALPSYAVLLCLLYPIVGLFLAQITLGYDILPLLFPLASGFVLLGPLAAVGFYQLSRQRERGLDASWPDALDILSSPSRAAITAVSLLLMGLFAIWIVVAWTIYVTLFGDTPLATSDFIHRLFATPAGWTLIIVGNSAGLLFAVIALIISMALPLLVDRKIGAVEALSTSIRAVAANPVMMTTWGVIVTGLLLVGSLPLFFGLAVVVPVLGHSTWHLYRKLI